MKKNYLKLAFPKLFRTLLALPLLFALSPVAIAGSLEDLRASGALGERFDGYVVARQASAQADAKEINAKRRKIYEERATAQGVDSDAVGRLYGKQILSKAPAGTWFLGEDGKWSQK
jgi:uncharacterized protein YdbL (DUF1318 family)